MILRLEQTTRCITMKEKPDKVPSLRFPNVYAFLITLLIKRKQTNENKNKAATPKTNKEKKHTHGLLGAYFISLIICQKVELFS